MKTFCALATLAAATAVENTAPVISLSLDGNAVTDVGMDVCNATLADRNTDAGEKSDCIQYDNHVAKTTYKQYGGSTGSHPHSYAAKGIFGASAAAFPEPSASAYDHHDSTTDVTKTYTYFVISRPACKSFTTALSSAMTSDQALEAGTDANSALNTADLNHDDYDTAVSTTERGNLASDHTCAMDQEAADVQVAGSSFTTEMRARRGEFIIKYDAEDRAGNKASQLVFAMILVDDKCPCPTGPALPDVEAMDSCAAILPFKEGKNTVCDAALLVDGAGNKIAALQSLDRSQIALDEKLISWKDDYDGFSPTMANANYLVRSHGLSYSITHDKGRVVNSNHGSASDIDQAVYDMTLSDAVATVASGDAGATVAYTTKDYANIFGYNYADNECVTPASTCDQAPATAWVIKDTLAPRIFANPNVDADGTDSGTVSARCGAEIANVPTFPDGRLACHAWNLRRRWCTATGDLSLTQYDDKDKCVGWSDDNTKLFRSGDAIDCTSEDPRAVHECGEAYKEPGYVCIDMRDSFSKTSEGPYTMTISGVNEPDVMDATGNVMIGDHCQKYHVSTEICSMHHQLSSTTAITYMLADGNAAGPAITTASVARDGTVFELAAKAQSENGYPLYGKNGECETDFIATYTCTDALDQTVSLNRTIVVKDTVDPTLEIATAGMNIINKQESTYAIGVNTTGVHVHGLYNVGNTSFTDSTHMDDKVFTGVRRNVQSDSSYVNNKANIAGDWHGDHTAANTYKNMNSHYHDTLNSNYDSEISSGTVGNYVNRRNFAGKTWTLKTDISSSGVQDSYVIQHSSGFDADEAVITNLVKAHKGFACYDACDGDLTHAMTSSTDNTGYDATGKDLDHGAKNGVTMSWHEHAADLECDAPNRAALDGLEGRVDGFNTLIPGTYVLKYVCEDECGNTDTKCRTILNEDHTKPVITVLEADDQTYEATRSDNYVDAGATCSDEVDGNISQDVEVSGDVVNLARVGVYTIKYNCQDSASNEADEATRTVTVQDTSCPSCIVSRDSTETTQYHEFTTSIEASFPYSDAGAVAQDTLQGSFGICSVWGLEEQGTTGYEGTYGMKASYKNIVNVERTGTYVITYRVKDSNGNWNDMTTANDGCTGGQTGGENKRTVVIIDTLRPVIELKYKGTGAAGAPDEQIIHRGAHEFTAGVGGDPRGDGDVPDRADDLLHTGAVHNPLLLNRQNTNTDHSDADNHRYQDGTKLMAEESATTAVNGWVIGAVASAVSGLALLGYSLRKSAAPVATSVPV